MGYLMAIESIILEEDPKFMNLNDSLSTIKSILNQFEPGDMAI